VSLESLVRSTLDGLLLLVLEPPVRFTLDGCFLLLVLLELLVNILIGTSASGGINHDGYFPILIGDSEPLDGITHSDRTTIGLKPLVGDYSIGVGDSYYWL